MSHYFKTPADQTGRHRVRATIWGRELDLVSAPGVFSAHRLDTGTQVLFRAATPPTVDSRRLLDLGCGFGPIAIALATCCPWAQVDAVDVNELALRLTDENAELHGVADRVRTALPESLPADIEYDEIWSNPPIRIGKLALPKAIYFADDLPKTRSGKIMRRILRKVASGELDQLGDTTTLADPSVVDDIAKGRQ